MERFYSGVTAFLTRTVGIVKERSLPDQGRSCDPLNFVCTSDVVMYNLTVDSLFRIYELTTGSMDRESHFVYISR
jgi:hypothetical protein